MTAAADAVAVFGYGKIRGIVSHLLPSSGAPNLCRWGSLQQISMLSNYGRPDGHTQLSSAEQVVPLLNRLQGWAQQST